MSETVPRFRGSSRVHHNASLPAVLLGQARGNYYCPLAETAVAARGSQSPPLLRARGIRGTYGRRGVVFRDGRFRPRENTTVKRDNIIYIIYEKIKKKKYLHRGSLRRLFSLPSRSSFRARTCDYFARHKSVYPFVFGFDEERCDFAMTFFFFFSAFTLPSGGSRAPTLKRWVLNGTLFEDFLFVSVL